MSTESPEARLERLDRLAQAVRAMGERFEVPKHLEGEWGEATSMRVLEFLGDMLEARGEVIGELREAVVLPRGRGPHCDPGTDLLLADFNFRGSEAGRGLLVADFEALGDQEPWSVGVTIESGMAAGELSDQLRSMADEIAVLHLRRMGG